MNEEKPFDHEAVVVRTDALKPNVAFSDNVIKFEPKKKPDPKRDIEEADFWARRHGSILGTLPDITDKTQDIEQLRNMCRWYEATISEMYEKMNAITDAYNIEVAETIGMKKED